MRANPPAFPYAEEQADAASKWTCYNPGMTLRDWFAGQALATVIANPHADYTGAKQIAADAYELADAMLAERQPKDTPNG